MDRRFLFALVASALVGLPACTSGGHDDDDADGGEAQSGQLSGACALRIINGESCPAEEGPVVLLVATDGIRGASCSGAFITPTKILTAAHCAELSEFGTITAYTGDTSVDVLSIIPDPRSGDPVFDTAVATTAFAVNVTPLPLFVSSPLSVGQEIFVYGFGTDENGQSGPELDFGNSAKRATMVVDEYEDGIVVASFNRNQTGACEGDSGGPVIAENGDGLFGIAAVVHGGTTTTCQADTLEVFTGVQTPGSVDFILSQAPGAGLI